MSREIEQNKYVIVQKCGGEHIRVLRFTPKQKILIEKLKFEADSAIGHPYGLFEVVGGKVSPIDPQKAIEMDGVGDLEMRNCPRIEIENISTSNGSADVEDEGTAPAEPSTPGPAISSSSSTELDPAQAGQALSQDDVLNLKSSGTSAGELVAKLVEGNKGFNARTAYAKNKYIRRKTKKHSDRVLILRPTIRLLTQSYYLKDADRMGNLRIDQLGLLLQMASVHNGKRIAVFDQVLGIVSAAVIERLGGQGTCVHIHRGLIAQSMPCVHSMNFDESTLSTFMPLRITKLLGIEDKSKDDTQSEETQSEEAGASAKEDEMETDSSEAAASARRNDRVFREQCALKTLEEGVDAVIIASRTVTSVSVLETLWPKLRSAGTIAIYHPNMQIIMEAQRWLAEQKAVNIALSDQLYRIHQVLPDRTHPLMAQHVVGGYVLSAIKVLP